jgi:hypothetical protein
MMNNFARRRGEQYALHQLVRYLLRRMRSKSLRYLRTNRTPPRRLPAPMSIVTSPHQRIPRICVTSQNDSWQWILQQLPARKLPYRRTSTASIWVAGVDSQTNGGRTSGTYVSGYFEDKQANVNDHCHRPQRGSSWRYSPIPRAAGDCLGRSASG